MVFDSPPDGTGYEQAKCPECDGMCMTVAFERQEQERHRNEAMFLSLLGSVTGLFSLHVPSRQQRRDISEPVTIVRYEDRLDAEKDVDVLARRGIEATLELTDAENPSWFGGTSLPCIGLKVPSDDVRRAREILHESDPPLASEEKRPRSAEDITFECEGCGETISFSGQCRGRVETCPQCHEYVDVPDD